MRSRVANDPATVVAARLRRRVLLPAIDALLRVVRRATWRLETLDGKLDDLRDKVRGPVPLGADAAKVAEIFKKVYSASGVRDLQHKHPFLESAVAGREYSVAVGKRDRRG